MWYNVFVYNVVFIKRGIEVEKEKSYNNLLVKFQVRDANFFVTFIDELTCERWGKFWGDVNCHFYNITFMNQINNIVVNFENCLYADPMALISVLLDLLRVKEDFGIAVNIILPRIIANDVENRNYKKGQFLKFLALHGFLKIMLSHFVVKDNKRFITGKIIEHYMGYNYKLPFSGNVIVPLKIYECYNENSKKEIIEEILNLFLFHFKGNVSTHCYNILEGYVYNIINELVENSIRHAYKNGEKKRFALYIRNRKSASGQGVNGFEQKEISKEKNNCPALDSQIYMENSAFMEIFFSDIGIGLTESLKDYYNSIEKDYTYPVRELFCKVLKDGVRRNNKTALTPFGGLHFICRIIRENNGYIWCNEGKEWVGTSSLRLLTEGSKQAQSALTVNSDNKQNHGLNWCFRIPYDDFPRGIRNTIATVWNGNIQSHPVLEAYKLRERDLVLDNIFCIDEINDNFLMNGRCKKWNTLDINNDIKNDLKIKTLIWKPKSNYTKNQIPTQLRKHLTKVSDINVDNIIISDINSSELLSYFYALNNNTAEALDSGKIKKIVLITNKWEVVCLKNVDNTFVRDRYLETDYFINNSKELSENIRMYASFIRKFDSFNFWGLVKKYKNEKLYINASVKWGNQNIHGYLDLERTYLYTELYDIISKSLLRMSGLIDDENVEYKNVDQTVERICQDINSNISIKDANVTLINVCGACVTGYTRESYYSENTSALDIILFLHPLFEKMLDDVSILFIWPESGFFDEFQIEKELYYRLGKTSFITTNPTEKLINTATVYSNVARDKQEMYDDFQIKTPKFIRYGHYKTDNHHYLIGFDFISYLKYSYYKKDGAFPYFLWRIIYYLIGEDIQPIYDLLKDQEWVKPLKYNKYKKDSNHGEIVIYHSNTFTEYIMKLIKSILPPSLADRIIPVSILNLQDKGSPLMFSPFVMKKIQAVFDDNNKKRGILYVDSSFSTGRRMTELENVFLASGCKKVSFLSILDMRRMRNADFKNSAFWKINLPRLDDNGHCILCDTLKKIENYKKKTDSIIFERLIIWERNWICMNINNSIGEHGIESVENLSCSFDDTIIHDSTTLNIYMAEKICESYNNDYIYTYITDKKTDLNKFLRIQLICTQIVLFGNQHSRKLQLSLLSELVGIMAKSTEVNAYTSLAGLVIISQKTEVIYELLNEILYLNQVDRIKQIKNSVLTSTNIDLVISIGYFLKNNYLIEQLINGFPDNSTFPFINMLNEHILPDKDLKLLFKEFEGLYVNEMGRRHNTNCQKLLTEHSTEYEDFEKRCNQVINDMNRLCELIKHFPIALKNSRTVTNSSRQRINDYISELIIEIRNRQQEYQHQKRENQIIYQYNASDGICIAVKECEKVFDEIINSYYIRYDKPTAEYFSHIISIYEKKYNKHVQLNITSDNIDSGVNKYYYWNSSIEKEFIYMLENLDHCTIPINDSNNNEKAMMKVEIVFQFNKISIKFYSWSEKMAAQVKDAFLSKNRLSKEQAIAFDVIFDFIDTKKDYDEGYFLLESQMSIPACYPQLKGE